MLSASQSYAAFKGKAYFFEDTRSCEMCGAPDSRSRILGQRMNVCQGLRTAKLQEIYTTIKRFATFGMSRDPS